MTPKELHAAKAALGLTWERLAEALGYQPKSGGLHLQAMAGGSRPIPHLMALVLRMALASRTARKVAGL